MLDAYKRDEFLAKPYDEGYEVFRHARGVDHQGNIAGLLINGAGAHWKELRKFSMTHLSNLGMGKNTTMEEVIMQEVDVLKEMLEKEQNTKGHIAIEHGKFAPLINNIIWRIVTGRRTSPEDPELIQLTIYVNEIFKNLSSGFLNLLQLYSSFIWKLIK